MKTKLQAIAKIGLVLMVLYCHAKTILSPKIADAQEIMCGMGSERRGLLEEQRVNSLAAAVQIPTSGSFHALIVFVKFNGDTSTDPCNNDLWLQWPHNATLPQSANGYLVPALSNGQAPSPPFADNTLTNYFYKQSNERFILYGEPFSQVIQTVFPESHYNITGTDNVSRLGMKELTLEVLNFINSQGFDFSRYDANNDGYIDHIFIITRDFATPPTWSGYSILGLETEPEVTYDGKKINWNLSGSFNRYDNAGNMIPLLTLGSLMAHEIGHDFWRPHFGDGHLTAITNNDVPSNNTNYIGYALMPGTNTRAGNQTISAFERDLLGWVNCAPMPANDVVNNYVNDLFTNTTLTNDCRTINLRNGSAGKRVYISNLQRNSYWNNLFNYNRTCINIQDGLMTTGLLVAIRSGTRYDDLPADNTLVLSSQSSTYAGDLFSPTTVTQITPFTRPNINGYNTYPSGYNPSPDAISNIRYTTNPGNQMSFDYIYNFNTFAIITEDSWIGEEFTNSIFDNGILIEKDVTLTIEKGVTIKIKSGKKIIVRGSLVANDVIFRGDEEHANWGGIIFEDGSTGQLENTKIESVASKDGAINISNSLVRLVNSKVENMDKDGFGIIVKGNQNGLMVSGGSIVSVNDNVKYVDIDNVVESDISDVISYPNPFNPTTVLRYSLSRPMVVSIRIYDVSGKLVRSLTDGLQNAGLQEVAFNALELPSGIYFYQVITEKVNKLGKILLIK